MFYLLTTDSSDSPIIEPATQQLNALQKWWSEIDWEVVIGIIIQRSLSILFITLLFFVLNRLVTFAIKHMFGKNPYRFSIVRLTTLRTLVLNVSHYTLAFFYTYSLLAILG